MTESDYMALFAICGMTIGLIHVILKCIYKMKCKKFECCWDCFKVERNDKNEGSPNIGTEPNLKDNDSSNSLQSSSLNVFGGNFLQRSCKDY